MIHDSFEIQTTVSFHVKMSVSFLTPHFISNISKTIRGRIQTEINYDLYSSHVQFSEKNIYGKFF